MAFPFNGRRDGFRAEGDPAPAPAPVAPPPAPAPAPAPPAPAPAPAPAHHHRHHHRHGGGGGWYPYPVYPDYSYLLYQPPFYQPPASATIVVDKGAQESAPATSTNKAARTGGGTNWGGVLLVGAAALAIGYALFGGEKKQS